MGKYFVKIMEKIMKQKYEKKLSMTDETVIIKTGNIQRTIDSAKFFMS